MFQRAGKRTDFAVGRRCTCFRVFDLCYAADSVREEVVMQWTQIYDPLGHWWLSTLVAGLPIIVLFGLLAGFKAKPHWCAIAGASTAVVVAILFFKMPPALAAFTFG